ncbi:hypothetical protein Pmar_PMAR001713, partial [Perkinsus marinus ATCC 50983]
LDEAAARGEKLTLLKLSEKCRKNLHCEIEGVAVATISLLKSSHLRETFDATAYSVNSYIEKRRTSSPRSIWEFTHREIESSVSRVFDSRAPQVELNVNEEKLRIVERKLNHGRLEIAATVDKDMPPQKILSDQEIQELRKYDGEGDPLEAVRKAIRVPRRFDLYGKRVASYLVCE